MVVCSFNGADGLIATLESLNQQSIRDQLQLIVVDDGSTPPIQESEVVSRGAQLIRHQENLGLSAARNTGVGAAHASIVAFTDDDCRPTPFWAEMLLSAYEEPLVAGAGGPVLGIHHEKLLARYYQKNEPIRHLESNLGVSNSVFYRFWLYVLANFKIAEHENVRDAYSLAGANFSFRLSILNDLGGFDPGIRFGGDDEELCHRLRENFPDHVLRIVPKAIVEHEYSLTISDLVRRSKAYGYGDARNYFKQEHLSPTIYPTPILFTLSLVGILAKRRRIFLVALVPILMAPRWLVSSFRSRSLEHLSYAYLQALQEASHNIGFAKGLKDFRTVNSKRKR